MATDREAIVYVVDDDPAMRASLRWLIESVGLAVRTCATADELLNCYEPSDPGCLVLDIRMPGMSGLDLQAELAARQLAIPVIIITGYGEVHLAVRAMKAGVFDFIEKPFSDQTLLERIRAAVDMDIANRRERAAVAEVKQRLGLLSAREREVMKRVVNGKSNKVVASELGLSAKTVEAHRAKIMGKLKADSLADLIRLWLLAGNYHDPL